MGRPDGVARGRLSIPWLEDQTRLRRATSLAPLHLDAPWSIFYGLLVLVAVTNYLPTRFGLSAVALGMVFILEYLALSPTGWPASRRAVIWSWIGWILALALELRALSARRAPVRAAPPGAALVLVP